MSIGIGRQVNLIGFSCWAIALLVEIKAQFNAPSPVITKNMFDVVVGLMLTVTVFYLAAITHIMPLPENALSRLTEFSLKAMDVLIACSAWVIRIFE